MCEALHIVRGRASASIGTQLSLWDKMQCSVIIVIMIVIVIMIISLMVDNITLSVCISIVTIALAIIVTAVNDSIMALSSQVAQPRLQVSNLSKKWPHSLLLYPPSPPHAQPLLHLCYNNQHCHLHLCHHHQLQLHQLHFVNCYCCIAQIMWHCMLDSYHYNE